MPRLRKFILEIVRDQSFFERDKRGRKIFRYKEESEFFKFKAKNISNAKKTAGKVEKDHKSGITIDSHLYLEL